MKNIVISSITSDGLKKGKYRKVLPEYYALESVIENNLWHLNQNVFDHVISVFKGLEKTLKLEFLNDKARVKINKYLKVKNSQYSKKELLMVATILHDIAKTETLIKDVSGSTKCPGHEIIGALMVKNFLSRFNLDNKDGDRVRKIVQYHGFISDILDLIISNGKKNEYFAIFKNVVGDICLELLLLMYSDLQGCDLRKSAPKEYNAREKIIIEFLS